MATIDNLSYQVKDRNTFIEEFQRQRGYPTSNQNSSEISFTTRSLAKGRWNYLHDLNKLKMSTLKEKIEKKKKEEEEKEMIECTFEPKLNKTNVNLFNYNTNTNFNCNNNKKINNSSIANQNIYERSEQWITNRDNKLRDEIQKEKEKEMIQCFFTPEINRENAVQKAKVYINSANLVEDPESYNNYIQRQKRKRDQDNLDKLKEQNRPGSGNIWRQKTNEHYETNINNRLYSNNNYNYNNNNCHNIFNTKIITRSKSGIKPRILQNNFDIDNHNLDLINKSNHNNNGLANNYLTTNSSTRKNCSKNVDFKNINKDKFYEDLYKRNSKNVNCLLYSEVKDKSNNTMNSLNTNNKNFYEQPMEYGKAIEILHDTLYSIDLENDDNIDDEANNNININEEFPEVEEKNEQEEEDN